MTFGQRLKELREERGLIQQEISELLGIGRPTVAGYETKDKQPDYEKLKQLADFFQVSIDYLLGRTDIRKPYIKDNATTKAYHNLDTSGLPDEAIKQVEEYIELIKLKYNPDGSLKKK